MNKICNRCKQLKIKELDFPIKLKRKSGIVKYGSPCKQCIKDRAKQKRRVTNLLKYGSEKSPIKGGRRKYINYIYKTKEELKAYQKSIRLERRVWLTEYKKTLSCYHCGLSFKDKPWLVDFHHLDPALKSFEISRVGVQKIESIMQEINKCIPLCANCHRTLHAAEQSPTYSANTETTLQTPHLS